MAHAETLSDRSTRRTSGPDTGRHRRPSGIRRRALWFPEWSTTGVAGHGTPCSCQQDLAMSECGDGHTTREGHRSSGRVTRCAGKHDDRVHAGDRPWCRQVRVRRAADQGRPRRRHPRRNARAHDHRFGPRVRRNRRRGPSVGRRPMVRPGALRASACRCSTKCLRCLPKCSSWRSRPGVERFSTLSSRLLTLLVCSSG